MSRWRPSPLDCIYVLPDIHGRSEELQLILKRILPLRKSDGGKDMLIFLGDYIDRGPDSPKVLDILIKLQQDYPDQVIFIRGNHEWLMLASAGRVPTWTNPKLPSPYSVWINNGGIQTITQYAARKGIEVGDLYATDRGRAIQMLDESHLDFLENHTRMYYETDEYIFVHAAFDPDLPMDQQNEEILLWDNSLFATAKRLIPMGTELPWEKCLVTGHNYRGPFISPKYLMLDSSHSKQLIVVELRSMEAYVAKWGKQRLVKFELTDSAARSSVRRVTSE